MRKTLYCTFILIVFAACNGLEKDDTFSFDPNNIVFYACNADLAETKTILQSSGTIEWLPKEEINVFYSYSNGVASTKFVSDNTEQSSQVTFRGSFENSPYEEGSFFWAVYPYNENNLFLNGDRLLVRLPSEQAAVAGSFDDDLFVSVARTTSFNMQFYNVCGGIEFSITEPGVKTVEFKGNADEQLAGEAFAGFNEDGKPVILSSRSPARSVTLSPRDGNTFQTGVKYYIATWPATLEKGYTITLCKEDGTSTVKRNNNPVTIQRAVWGVLEYLDRGLSYEVRVPENEIWYTTTDGKALDNYFGQQRDYYNFKVVSNTYSDGMGKFVFSHPVTAIPLAFFAGAESLSAIVLPEGLKSIGYQAFQHCSSLQKVSFPEGLESIVEFAFFGCSSLQEVILPEGLESIGRSAFACCSSLQKVSFPERLESIGELAFYYCSSLQEIILPEGLESIGGSAFSGCSSLQKVSFPERLKSIEQASFFSCSSLQEIILPESLESVGSYAFGACNSLKTVKVLSKTPPTVDASSFRFDGDYEPFRIFIPAGTENAYTTDRNWKAYLAWLRVEGDSRPLYYFSKDYSKDGEVLQLQKATVGKGINIILMGDGFVDRDMEEGGKYERVMRKAMEAFFVAEPFRTFRDRFNVYLVKVVSENDIFGALEAKRKLSKEVEGGGVDTFSDVAEEYAALVPNPDNQPLRVCVQMNEGGALLADWGLGNIAGWCSYDWDWSWVGWTFWSWEGDFMSDYDPTIQTFIHENCGHGFGWLFDEYTHTKTTPFPLEYREDWDYYHSIGENINTDWRSNPETVLWSRFLKDERYSSEGLGIYEGAFWPSGIYRASMNSVMNNGNNYFPAPVREHMYKLIMQFSEGDNWEYDYEKFVEIDEAGRKQVIGANNPSKTNNIKLLLEGEPVHCSPPTLINRSVKRARIGRDGSVTILYD